MSSPYDTGRFAEVDGLDQVSSHADAARIVVQMLDDLRAHPTEWENRLWSAFSMLRPAAWRVCPVSTPTAANSFRPADVEATYRGAR